MHKKNLQFSQYSVALMATAFLFMTGCEQESLKIKEPEILSPEKTLDKEEKSATPAKEPENRKNVVRSVDNQVGSVARKKSAEKRKMIQKEAVQAIEHTRKALKAIENRKKEKALDELETAAGKLAIVTARDPSLSMAAIEVQVETFDLAATVEGIEKARSAAEELLEDGDIQQARSILDDMASEMIVSVVYVPLGSYPDAIKAISPLIDQEKFKRASRALEAALSTLVVEEVLIPLPIIRAERMMMIAESLMNKKKLKKRGKKRLENFIENAQYQLKLAETLGYLEEEQLELCMNQIEKVRAAAGTGQSGKGVFKGIKKTFSDLRKSVGW